MSFSVSTCLSNTGTASLGPTLSIYSNPVTTTNPGTFVRTVSTSMITGSNCPFTFLVPDGTQTIRIFDPVSFCYVDIAVSDNNVCNTCDLGLSGVTNNLVSIINVNGLSGTCDNSVDNYILDWYGPDSSTTYAFSSGKGTQFSPYQYTHPINNINSPILEPGTYISRIRNVELNGVKFSSTGGTGNVSSCSLTGCTDTVIVSPYNCSNGTGGGDALYTHYKEFIYTDSSISPQSLSAKFNLSANTQSFIWKFEGLTIYDTLKLTFSGSSYPQPILLEQIKVGEDSGGTNFTPSTWPKSTSSQNIKKITVLTGLTVNNNDSIIINITPNPSVNSTSWKYHFGCSSLPTATKNCLDSYRNSPYKINSSTITYLVDSCNRYQVSYSVSGCSTNENLGFTNSNLVNLNTSFSQININTDNVTKLLNINTSYSLYNNFSQITSCGPGRFGSCVNIYGRQIKVVKTATTQVEIYFTHLSDLNVYYNDWSAAQASLISSCGTYSSNSFTFNYYKFITLGVYNGTYSCGDNSPSFEDLYFHYSSVISSGNTSSYPGFNYYMFITTPLITNNYTCPNSCSNCANASTYTSLANNTRNTTGFIRNVTGYRRSTPFRDVNGLKSVTQSNTNQTLSGYLTINDTYSNFTYPASGVTNTLIPSLSGTTWDWENHMYNNGFNFNQTVFSHNVVVTSWSPFQYKIQALQISNFTTTGTYIDVWSSTSGILNSNYVY